MLFLDVNILVYALRPDASERARMVEEWLTPRLYGHESLGISELVLSSVARIATNHRVFGNPSSPEQCMEFAQALLEAPAAVTVRPGPRHWPIFSDLVTAHRLRGDDVPDAYLASLAMEHGASMVTLDRGFSRFEGLRTVDPLA